MLRILHRLVKAYASHGQTRVYRPICLLLTLPNKVLLEHNHTHCLHVVCGCCCYTA